MKTCFINFTKMMIKLPLLYVAINIMLCDGKLFKIAWMVPGNKSKYPINVGTSAGALALAVNAIAKNPTIMNGHQIGVKTFETECDSGSGMMAAMAAQRTYGPDVFIGPPCREAMQTVARYGAFWNLPIFSWYNPDTLFDDYHNLIRVHPPFKFLANSLVQILRDRNETTVSIVYDSGTQWTTLNEAVESALAKVNIGIQYKQQYINTLTDAELDHLITPLQSYGRTIVFMMPTADVRRCIHSTIRTGMQPEHYNFIHLDSEIYTDTQLKNEVLSDQYWKTGPLRNPAVETAYSHLIHVIFDPMNDDDNPSLTNPRSRFTDFINLGKAMESKNNTGHLSIAKLDVYSLYLYDAVSMWSVLTDQLLKQNISHRDGKAMAQKAQAFHAEGSTGFIVLDNGADRIAKVFVLRMGAVGAFIPQRIIRFDTAGRYTVNVLEPELVNPGAYHLSAQNKMTEPTGTTLDPLHNIVERLAQLERAITSVINHDHAIDHPPNGQHQQSHLPPPHEPQQQSYPQPSHEPQQQAYNSPPRGPPRPQQQQAYPQPPHGQQQHTYNSPPYEPQQQAYAAPHRGPQQKQKQHQQQQAYPPSPHEPQQQAYHPNPHVRQRPSQPHAQQRQPKPHITQNKKYADPNYRNTYADPMPTNTNAYPNPLNTNTYQVPPKAQTHPSPQTPPTRPPPTYVSTTPPIRRTHKATPPQPWRPTLKYVPSESSTTLRANQSTSINKTVARAAGNERPFDTLAAQLLAKLSGVIDQKINSLQSKQNVTTTPAPPPTTTPPVSGEQPEQQGPGDYAEMMSRLHEELPPEMSAYLNFGPPPEAGPYRGEGAGRRRGGPPTPPPWSAGPPPPWVTDMAWW